MLVRREDLGLAIDGGRPGTDADGSRDSQTGTAGEERSMTLKEVSRTPAFWTMLASLFLVSNATSGYGLHLVPHLTEMGVNPAAAVAAISVTATSGAAGVLLVGTAADRASPRWMMVSLFLVATCALGILVVTDTLFETYLFAVVMGFSSAGINTLVPIMWASYYGRGALGALYGVSRAVQVTGFAIGPLASGIAYDATGSYREAFIVMAGVALIAALIMAASGKWLAAQSNPR